MKIAILSDTHNQIENLERALNHLRRENIYTLVHCGDFTDPDMLRVLYGFHVIAVFGNGDYASGLIRQTLLEQNHNNWVGLVFSGELGGVRLAVTHGHIPGKADELVRSGQYQYVFIGHSHLHHDIPINNTRLINPGALGGKKVEPRQFCILDLKNGEVQFIEV